MIETASGTTSTLSPLAENVSREARAANEFLQSTVNETLEAHLLQLPEVSAKADHGRVRLTGRVRTYYLKQLAQTLVLATHGVRALENDLIVE